MNIIFAGTPDFAVPVLQMLLDSEHQICAVYSQPDRPSGRGRKLTASPVKTLALAHEIEVIQPASLKSTEAQAQLQALQADLMIVVAYGLILPQAVLDSPRLGCVNVHASLLPRWRGAAPIQRAILAGDPATGITIMQMSAGLDTGPMLLQSELAIGPQETASELHDRLSVLGAETLKTALTGIEAGTLKAQVQNEETVTYAAKLDKQEAVIDWSQSAENLACQVRAFNSWPVAQTRYQDKVLRIWQAEPVAEPVTSTAPGSVLNDGDHKHLNIATGKGVLRLLEVQLPGGKRMSAQAFLNAHKVTGLRLG